MPGIVAFGARGPETNKSLILKVHPAPCAGCIFCFQDIDFWLIVIEVLKHTAYRMFVKCLGSGDAFGSGGKFNTCFYIRTESLQILLDCGATSMVAAKRQNISPDDIDVILITHLHGDHFGGLPFFLCEIAAMKRRKKTLTIVGPHGTRERTLDALECMYPGVLIDDDTPVRFQTYSAGVPLFFKDIEVTAYTVTHSPESNPHCLRIAHGNKIVTYSGDTEWTDSLITASDGADLFICEATTYIIAVKQHLAVNDLLTRSSQLNAGRIVLTHLADEALQHTSETFQDCRGWDDTDGRAVSNSSRHCKRKAQQLTD